MLQVLRCISASGRRKSEKHVRYLPQGSKLSCTHLQNPDFWNLETGNPHQNNKAFCTQILKKKKQLNPQPPNSPKYRWCQQEKKHSGWMSLLTFMLTCSTCIQVAWHHPRILLHHPMQGRLKGEGALISWVLLFVAVQSGYPVDSLLYHTVLYYLIQYHAISISFYIYI